MTSSHNKKKLEWWCGSVKFPFFLPFMTDKPTSPIAWMANAYSPTASSFKEKRQSSFTLETKTMNSNQSIERFIY